MAEQFSSPRITAPYLDSFVGRLVTIVGKVTQLRGDQATIDADGIVTAVLNRVGKLFYHVFTFCRYTPHIAGRRLRQPCQTNPGLRTPT